MSSFYLDQALHSIFYFNPSFSNPFKILICYSSGFQEEALNPFSKGLFTTRVPQKAET